ncbi:RING finger protein B [Phytophthora citrophthora]|uniref:RING finger protein B n=1 Tax=Phytophthora citrophthora TaxID=4793 RepID=A0AAD9LBK6_9STRA|nr:RING finger protein B [Phytophthora citrophthora]
MSNYSEDDWSLVSEDEETQSNMSFDEVDPEPEVQVEFDPEVEVVKVETSVSTCTADELSIPEGESADVVSLLSDNGILRSVAGYSREIRVSLLSPAHQARYTSPPPEHSSPVSTDVSPKRNIKLAFIGTDTCPKSFPERLRALTSAMCPGPEEISSPTFTEVTSFKQDQCTQANLDTTADQSHKNRAALLRDALDRCMTMANQLRAKDQDNERLSIRIAEMENVAAKSEQQSRRDSMMLKMNERSLALAKQQAQLTAEYQDNLKAISDSLRRENAQISAQNAVLRGDDEALEIRSLDELEELESILVRGMENVRAALRSKYRLAVEKTREKELCVVCFEKPVAVVLLPCRHQVLCASCAVRVPICPIDRKGIQDKVLTYGLSAYADSDK